ncbi:hypothetical protein ACLH0O_19135, partial [Aeromonas media]
MKRLILGAVLAVCSGNIWAHGLSPKLHNDTCQYHAALAKEFMGMRLDGKTKAEVLADCSGQLNPDTWLGRSSAFAGAIPSLC